MDTRQRDTDRISAGYTTDIRSPHERYIDGILSHIEEEARLTKPPYTSFDAALRDEIADRFERGILSRDERDTLMRSI